jgi:hypothetical protein
MKSWIKSVWVKRLVPLVLLVAVWGSVTWWEKRQDNLVKAERDRIGSVVAQVWLATATFRDKPEQYIAYRDSVLKARNVTRQEILDYMSNHADEPDIYLQFTQAVSGKVDSLYKIADSTWRANRKDTGRFAIKPPKKPVDTTPKIQKRKGTVPVPRI